MTSGAHSRRTMLRHIFALSIPSIVTNITTPLLGMTDVAITGHMGSAVYIAAIAVGGNMFNMLYWLLGFLRMGSSGMTAQAYGSASHGEAALVLWRSLLLAMTIGILFVILQTPICRLLFDWMDVAGETRTLAGEYFHLLIWGAPAALGSFALTGWFLGMQNSRAPMWVSLTMDVTNIAASLLLVYAVGMGIRGLALGTLIAQWGGLLLALAICLRRYRPSLPPLSEIMRGDGILRYFRINTDIFLRTVCLVAVTLWFTRTGASQGPVVLAVNALLMQLFTFFSFFMDGFAFSGEALCGRYKGAGDATSFRLAVRMLFLVSGIMAALFTMFYLIAGTGFLHLLSDDPDVVTISADYFGWAVTIPVAGFVAFTADGIFIGSTATRRMLISMACATAVFFGVYFLAFPTIHNHGLWLAFITYLLTRGAVLLILMRGIQPPYSAR